MYKLKDFAKTTLNEALDNSETGVDVVDATKVEIGSIITVWSVSYDKPSEDSGREKMIITNIVGNTLTVERAYDGTSASEHASGDNVAIFLNTSNVQQIADVIEALDGSDPDTLLEVNDGIADATSALNAFLTANAGRVVRIPTGEYKISGTIAIPANTIVFAYATRIFDVTTSRTLITGASGGKLIGAEVEGNGNASYDADSNGIVLTGSSGSEVLGFNLRDCYIHNIGQYGIKNEYSWDVYIDNCVVEDIGYAGIMTLSGKRVHIHNSHIDGITPGTSSNCYGVAFTEYSGQTRSEDCSITDSVVENSTIWEGIDTHGGKAIRIENNVVRGSAVGIVLKMAPSSGDADHAATDCIVKGNVVYGGGNIGCYINGASNLYAANNIIDSNVFVACGTEGGSYLDQGSIYIGYTKNTIISNNIIRDSFCAGIILRRNNEGAIVTGNMITDVQNTTGNNAVGITVYVSSEGLIANNQMIIDNAALNDVVGEIGIYVGGDAGNNITIGPNQNRFTTPFSGADERVNFGYLPKPMARGYSASGQTNLVNTTSTPVVLDGESYDVGGNFASNAFTAPIAGKYRIHGCVMFANVIAAKLYAVQIKSGATVLKDNYGHSGLASSLSIESGITVELAAGAVITLNAISFSGGDTVDIQAGSRYTHLEVEFIQD